MPAQPDELGALLAGVEAAAGVRVGAGTRAVLAQAGHDRGGAAVEPEPGGPGRLARLVDQPGAVALAGDA